MIHKQFFAQTLTRTIIIGLTAFFFILAGVVTVKTLQIPSKPMHSADKSREVRPDGFSPGENSAGQFDNKRPSERAVVGELRPLHPRGEEKLSGKEEKPRMNVQPKASSKGERVLAVFGDGMFRSGQFEFDNNQRVAIEELVRRIRTSPDHHVLIEGYTDNIRPSAGKRYLDNMELSFLRAKAVALILVNNGVAMDRISVIGYGDTRPLASNGTIEGRAKNRRVEVKLVGDSKGF